MEIRPIYEELQSLVSQAPEKGNYLHKSEQPLIDRVNELIGNLIAITQDDSYKSSEMHIQWDEGGYFTYSAITYRGILHGLISKLHAKFFTSEPAAFSVVPSTVMTQTANQSQNISIEIAVQLGEDLHKALEKAETLEEKNFIEELKLKIGTVKSYVDFLLLVVSTAQAYGITLDKIEKLFKVVIN